MVAEITICLVERYFVCKQSCAQCAVSHLNSAVTDV